MCGIIGIVGNSEVSDRLLEGLRRMEYRGYDSAGVCTVHDGQLERRRAEGKLANLARVLDKDDAPGNTGIAHTRWATHGPPNRSNDASARDRRGRAGPQRHHRKFQAVARSAGSARARVRKRHRHRSCRASGERADRGRRRTCRRRARRAAPASRCVRPCHRVSRASRSSDWRAVGLAAGRRLRRGRDVLRFRRACACPADAADRLPGRRRHGRGPRRHRADSRRPRRAGRTRDHHLGRLRRGDREGPVPALHAERDLRAADGRGADIAKLYPAARTTGRAAADRL